jgi:hypothetical protein
VVRGNTVESKVQRLSVLLQAGEALVSVGNEKRVSEILEQPEASRDHLSRLSRSRSDLPEKAGREQKSQPWPKEGYLRGIGL